MFKVSASMAQRLWSANELVGTGFATQVLKAHWVGDHYILFSLIIR